MANQEHLDILKQGVGVWNNWRDKEQDTLPDLRGADLSSMHFIGFDLVGADFTGAKLVDTNFYGAKLASIGRVYKGSIGLLSVDLVEADLTGASLSFVDLSGVNLTGANLTDASLAHAKLLETNLNKADLTHTFLYYTNFSLSKFDRVNFTNARMSWAIFGNVDLSTAMGLETVSHEAPLIIGVDTIYRSQGNIPEVFLRRAGIPDSFITYASSLVQNPIEYYTCFISYSSKDQKFAERLYTDLQSSGVHCWFAPEDMDIGDKIRPRIDETIRRYDKVLLVLSEHSIKSNWVAYEVEKALNKEPEGIPNALYPIRLDKAVLACETQWAKDVQRTRHIGNFECWEEHDEYQKSFNRLLRALKPR